jgi:hypothetical protein
MDTRVFPSIPEFLKLPRAEYPLNHCCYLGSTSSSSGSSWGSSRTSASPATSSSRIHLTGVHLKGVHLAGVRLIGVRLRGLHLRGVYPRGVYCAHLTGVYLRDVRLRASKLKKEKRKRDTELDQIGGKGATQWCSKRGSLAAGDSVDTESSSTTAGPGSTSSTLPSSPSHRWALSTGSRMRGG